MSDSLTVVFVRAAIVSQDEGDLDTAIISLGNALCVRNLRPFNRLEILKIMADMQYARRHRHAS